MIKPGSGGGGGADIAEKRRLERPWTVEETASAFVVRTANGFVVSLTYFDNEPRRRSFNLTRDEARRVAANIAKLPDLLTSRKTET
jgi:hypothetical protein